MAWGFWRTEFSEKLGTEHKQDKRLNNWVRIVTEVLSASLEAMIFLIFYATEGFWAGE